MRRSPHDGRACRSATAEPLMSHRVVRPRIIPTNRSPVTLFRRAGSNRVLDSAVAERPALPTIPLMRLSLSISLCNALPPVRQQHRNDDNFVNDLLASLGIYTTDNIDCRSGIKITPAIVPRNVPRPPGILAPPKLRNRRKKVWITEHKPQARSDRITSPKSRKKLIRKPDRS
jgi:hypothetical protein